MSLDKLKMWPIGKKIAVSMMLLFVAMLVLNGIVTLLSLEGFQEFTNGVTGVGVNKLALEATEGTINDIEIFKRINEIITQTNPNILNTGFYLNMIYNLVVFLGLGLLFAKLFQPKALKSFTFENKTPILFLASIILSINVQQIGNDAVYLNELLGLNSLQERLFGVTELEDNKNLISNYIMLFPNAERGWFITFIGLALVPAIGEEVMFRGYLMKLFNQNSNHHNGIALSALIFALIHFNFTNFFYYFVLGVILGYIYYWGKNLLFPIIIHFIHNGLVLFIFLKSTSVDEVSGDAFSGMSNNTVSIMAYVTVGLSLAIFYMNYQRRRDLIK